MRFEMSNLDSNIRKIITVAKYAKISEHTPGKIVMKFSFSNLPKVTAYLGDSEFSHFVYTMPGIKRFNVNSWTRSLEITYDPEILPFSLWEDLGNIGTDPAREELVMNRIKSVLET
jgi:hypothetical protein